jgi:hypothetical protein
MHAMELQDLVIAVEKAPSLTHELLISKLTLRSVVGYPACVEATPLNLPTH